MSQHPAKICTVYKVDKASPATVSQTWEDATEACLIAVLSLYDPIDTICMKAGSLSFSLCQQAPGFLSTSAVGSASAIVQPKQQEVLFSPGHYPQVPWNHWNNCKKRVYTVKDKDAADGGGKDGEEESDRNQGNTKVNRRHSPVGELRSCVRVCSPVDVCFLSPTGLEKLQKPTFVLQDQLPTKPACFFTLQAVLFHSDFSQS